MKLFFIGLLALGSLTAFAESQSFESCAYDATTMALETGNATLTKNQVEQKILNIVERECLMREFTTIQDQANNPSLIKGIKSAIIDYKKSHKNQGDIRDMISSML